MALAPGTLWQEFKTFAFKGNMLDLAVGVIIGAAFGKVVASLVDHIFMPLLAASGAGGKGYEGLMFTINGSEVKYGLFIGALINFLLVALAIFFVIVKVLNSVMRKASPPPQPGEPTTKECPYCVSSIPIRATRCGHCTSELSSPTTPVAATI